MSSLILLFSLLVVGSGAKPVRIRRQARPPLPPRMPHRHP